MIVVLFFDTTVGNSSMSLNGKQLNEINVFHFSINDSQTVVRVPLVVHQLFPDDMQAVYWPRAEFHVQ